MMIISHTMGHPGDGETGRREVRMKRMPVPETGRKEVEQLRREVRMRRMPVSETVKTLLVKYIITTLHRYQWRIYKDYILAHQEEDSLFQGTKIESSGNRGNVEENPFRVTPAKMRGGCQVN